MAAPQSDLDRQIEAAFRFRGHVTVHLQAGEKVEGYLYNRDSAPTRVKGAPYVELFLKGSGAPRKLLVSQIAKVELSGEDCAKT